MNVTLPDGTVLEGVPDGTTRAELLAKLSANGYDVRRLMTAVSATARPDPTEGMSTTQKVLAGVGKAFSDTARGAGQMVGLVDRTDVAESRRLDADLMKHTPAKIGEFAGNVVTTLPLAFVPGANTMKGAALIGAGTGLMQPSASTSETLTNTGMGGAAGPAGLALGRLAGATYQMGTGLVRPLTEKGQRQIAAELFAASATDPVQAAQNMAKGRALVKGSNPTIGQIADDPGLAQLERTLYNNPEAQGPIARAYRQQGDARRAAIAEVAGTPEHRTAVREGRRVFANEDYAKAVAQGVDPDMAKALQPQIESLLRRPSIQDAKQVATDLAAEQDIALTNFGSIEGLDWLKKGLDNQISAATSGASSIGKDKLRALVQTKADLMNTMEQLAPAYKAANDNYAAMSRQVNASDVAADLQSRLYKNAEWGSGKEMGATYMAELSKALESIKKATGQDRGLSDVMPRGDLNVLESVARDLARKENAQMAGRAVGSPTMQNMLGQNLLQRTLGPLGAPGSFAQGALASYLTRPYEFVMKSAEPKVLGALAEAMTDPAGRGADLMRLANARPAVNRYAAEAEKYMMLPGLLALENGQ